MRDPLVRLGNKQKPLLGRQDPVLQGAGRGQAPERVVDLNAVQAARVVLEKLLGGQIRGVETRLPTGIRKP